MKQLTSSERLFSNKYRYDLAYINLGIVLYHQGKKFKAIQACSEGIRSNPARVQDLIYTYQKQVEVAKEELITINDTDDDVQRLRLMTRLKALEQVLDLLQLPSKELSNMLVPSSHQEKLEMKPSNNETLSILM